MRRWRPRPHDARAAAARDAPPPLPFEERLHAALGSACTSLRPPPRRRVSEWADENFYLSPESAAEPGRWKCLPYQVGILDAFSDPLVESVAWMKSARVGYTKCVNIVIGYHIKYDPCPISVVQPTIEDAEGSAKKNSRR
jgi:phage terminase large subunit GpA-like protein